ncbi:MAG TPA: MFS transporter [Steroidobacteraceae bacterium]|nr:MFS transporter [Steroidobacteraceae bacterium]
MIIGQSRRHEFAVVAVLCLAWGVVSVEYLSLGYLAPFIEPALNLSNTQVGILVSGACVCFALSSYVTGAIADRIGKRRQLIVSFLLAFSAASVLSGFATSFLTLLAARLLMGLLEGPILPLAQSIVALESPTERRGLNMGIVQTVGFGLLTGMAPLLLVALAGRYGWRSGFFVVALPGLICAGLLWVILRGATAPLANEKSGASLSAEEAAEGRRPALRSRNIWLCCAVSLLYIGFFLTATSYLPLFYVKLRQLPPAAMSALMSSVGIAGIVMGVLVPALADRIGRKPTAILASAVGVLCPLAALLYVGPLPILWLLMFIGLAPIGVSTLSMATIPAESVPVRSISRAIGLCVGIGTLVGGGAGPTIAGWIADRWNLRGALLFQAGCAALMAVLAIPLRETLVRKSARG